VLYIVFVAAGFRYMLYDFFVLSTVIYRNFILLFCSFSMINCRFVCASLNSCSVRFTSVGFSLYITSYTYYFVFCEDLVYVFVF
jgi:hypothetical protein